MLCLNPYHAVAREDLDGSVIGAGVLVAAQAASILILGGEEVRRKEAWEHIVGI